MLIFLRMYFVLLKYIVCIKSFDAYHHELLQRTYLSAHGLHYYLPFLEMQTPRMDILETLKYFIFHARNTMCEFAYLGRDSKAILVTPSGLLSLCNNIRSHRRRGMFFEYHLIYHTSVVPSSWWY